MTVIQHPAKLFMNIIGEQIVDSNKKYRFINFVLIKKHKEKYLVYNNLTKEFIVISDDEFFELENSSFDVSNAMVKQLIKRWFLVPIEFDDIKLNNQVVQLARQLKYTNTITDYTILPTTGCNARCFYCFEKGTKPINMSVDTAKEVAKFIIEKSGNNNVSLKWFGGEPLCNVPAIDIICNHLNKNNKEFISSIVTNGYLFNEELIRKFIEKYNLKQVQITLDGTEEIYNKIKNYINSDTNPFKKVINNIGLLIKENIKVIIRLNMDSYNSEDLFNLVDYIYKKFGNNPFLKIYPHLLFENSSENSVKKNNSKIRNEIIKKYYQLKKHIDCYNYLNKKTTLTNNLTINQCMADSYSSVVILPEGNLGKCEHFLTSNIIGNIHSFEKNVVWNSYCPIFEQCNDCAMIPSCIFLSECPTSKKTCSYNERKEKINNLEERMIKYYEQYIKKENGMS